MDPNDPLYIDPNDVDLMTARQQAANALDLVVRLRDRRERLGLTQRQVAGRMSRHNSVVSNLERLGSDPRWSSVQRYASALGFVIQYDLTETLPDELRRMANRLEDPAEDAVDALSVARRVASR